MTRPSKKETEAEKARVAAKMAENAKALQTRLTCEGCGSLRTYPRPMCTAESSPHWRTPCDTHSPRCASFSVRMSAQQAVKPEPAPASRFAVAGNATKGRRKYVVDGNTRRMIG